MLQQSWVAGRRRGGLLPVGVGIVMFGGLLAVSTLTSAGSDGKAQPLPRSTPEYMRFTYPAAMAVPLPQRTAAAEPPAAASPLQTYANATGLLGIYQGAGVIAPASNAFFQSLGTNGRSCFSCHRPSDGLSLNTTTLNRLFDSTAGQDPVFAPVDGANCPSSVLRVQQVAAATASAVDPASLRDAYSLLLNRGLFRVFLPLPKAAEFTLTVVSDPYGCNTDPRYATQVDPQTGEQRQMVSVYRRPRMSANLIAATTPALTTLGGGGLPNIDFVTGAPVIDPATGREISGNLMWDGREPTLESQAISATLGHAQALVPPTAAQVAEMVTFESRVLAAQLYDNAAGYLNTRSGAAATGGPEAMFLQPASFGVYGLYDAWPTSAPAGSRVEAAAAKASIARGQAIFNSRAITVDNVAGFNNARLLGVKNPTVATCASCHGNMPTGGDPFSAGQRDIGIGGQGQQFGGQLLSKDLPMFRLTCSSRVQPGFNNLSVLTNDPGLALVTGRCADIGRRSVPQLRALAARAPYFSDGSAATLEDVARFYNQRFGMGLSAGEVSDLAHFLEAL